MQGAQHFETAAAIYGQARPPYPAAVYEQLTQAQVIGPGMRVLEIGAGTGQATTELIRAGCHVTAVEPGTNLAHRLATVAPQATIINAPIESVDLPPVGFDSFVAATSMHWVDLPTALPRLHEALVPGGKLAVWRTIFGDPRVHTPFRDAVSRIASRRPNHTPGRDPLNPPPTVSELEEGGWFTHTNTWTHAWHIDLTPRQVTRLFHTFSDWTDTELKELAAVSTTFGPVIREHYVTHLHLLSAT